MKLNAISTGLLTLTTLLVPAIVNADAPGRHPAYLRARTDLRRAQILLRVHDEPNVMRNLRAADEDVENAIGEIDRAAVIDRKDLEENPPANLTLDRPGRLRRIVELLRSARMDLAGEEDDGAARGWRNRAYHRRYEALGHMRRAAVDLKLDHDPGF